jgi:hypothetical protein
MLQDIEDVLSRSDPALDTELREGAAPASRPFRRADPSSAGAEPATAGSPLRLRLVLAVAGVLFNGLISAGVSVATLGALVAGRGPPAPLVAAVVGFPLITCIAAANVAVVVHRLRRMPPPGARERGDC